jgi:DHA2 family multidrug resistance protein
MTAGERSFLNRELLKSPNFVAGSLLMFGVGRILTGTLALVPSMMQVLLNYLVFDDGWMMAPRGFGTMLAMFIVARIIDRVDNRLFAAAQNRRRPKYDVQLDLARRPQ